MVRSHRYLATPNLYEQGPSSSRLLTKNSYKKGAGKDKGSRADLQLALPERCCPQVDTREIPAPSHTVVGNDMELHQRT